MSTHVALVLTAAFTTVCWVITAFVTPRVPAGLVWMPYHFGGWWMGEDQRGNYPPGAAHIVLGEAVNTGWTYGYDVVTMMQETKVSLCRLVTA